MDLYTVPTVWLRASNYTCHCQTVGVQFYDTCTVYMYTSKVYTCTCTCIICITHCSQKEGVLDGVGSGERKERVFCQTEVVGPDNYKGMKINGEKGRKGAESGKEGGMVRSGVVNGQGCSVRSLSEPLNAHVIIAN